MSDVFVSYATEDRRRVKPLVDALQADGFSVWWDEQIGGGTAWRHAIETELNAAKCVVVVWSRHSAAPDSAFVHDEATRAQERHVYVPVTIDKIHLPLGFGETQALPLTGWRGYRTDPKYQAVLAAVCRNAGSGAPTPRTAPRLGRRTVIAGAAAGAAIVAGAGGWMLFETHPTAAASNSIAVMPFDNLSGDPAQAYFSDGMAEELRSALVRIPHLKVVARTSSEAVRNVDARTAARMLGVANILTGSVRRSSTTIRISAQLVDGHTGLERWSQDFDQPIGDTLVIQSQIAQSVTEALRIQLGDVVKTALTLGGTANVSALDHFLKAKLGRADDTAAGLRHAITELEAAIQLDPNYAQAYAGKATVLAFYAADWARTPSEVSIELNQAVAAAKRAIALAPKLAQGHSALGFAYKLQLRFKDALREMRIATSLPGVDADAQGRYALLLVELGQGYEAQDVVERAISLDPLNPGAYQQQAMLQFLSHRFPAAADAARRSLELNSSGTFVRGILANASIMMGRYKDAAGEFARMPPDSFQALTGKGIIAARTGDGKALDSAVEQLTATFGESVNYELAEIYAQRGDADSAIAYLRKPESQRDPGFIFILGDPFLDPLRGDPRFKAIVRDLGLPIPR